jgi:hypothetical protein
MPSGLPILRLQASGHRTSGNGSSGWLTPKSSDGDGGWQGEIKRATPGGGLRKLVDQAVLVGWPTPDASAMNVGADPVKQQDRRRRLQEKHQNGNGAGMTLGFAAALAGWRSPRSNDWKGGVTGAKGSKRAATDYFLPDQVNQLIPGAMPGGLPVSTEKRGALNPALSRWLMGFPPEHLSCAPTATRSSRKSPRPSSDPSSKQSK